MFLHLPNENKIIDILLAEVHYYIELFISNILQPQNSLHSLMNKL